MSDYARHSRSAGAVKPPEALETPKVFRSVSMQEDAAAANAQIQRTMKAWRSVSGEAPIMRKAEEPVMRKEEPAEKPQEAKEDAGKKDEGAEAKGGADEKEGVEVSDPNEPAEKEADAKADEIAEEEHGGEKKDEKDEKKKGGAQDKDKKKQGGAADLGDEKKEGAEGEEKKEEPKAAPPVAAKLMRKVYLAEDPAAKPAADPAKLAKIPTTQEAYEAHVQAKFAGPIGELAAMGEDFKAKGGDAKRQSQTLDLSLGDVTKLKEEYEKKKGELDEGKRKAEEAKIAGQTAALPNAGSNMQQMLDKAKELVKQIQEKGNGAKAEKSALEGVMNAAMMLATQIDPEGSGKGRSLYESIDKGENPSLVAEARAAGMPEAEVAQMAVNHRNWLRAFFRNKIMVDQTNAEILFLRDQGIVGSRDGLTMDQVMKKVIGNLMKPNEKTKEAALRADFTMETATEEELNKIYAGVIGSAATTNAGVSGNMGAKPGG
jgi:hypothetical protein